jgi:hypothetical protein
LTLLSWGRDLVTPATPYGLVSLEVAGDPVAVAWMVETWNAEPDLDRKAKATFSVGFDFLFIPCYSTLLAFACASGMRGLPHGWLKTLGAVLAWGQHVAGLCDVVGNVALLMILFTGASSAWVQSAQLFALLKFALIASGLFYGCAVWVRQTTPALFLAIDQLRRPGGP